MTSKEPICVNCKKQRESLRDNYYLKQSDGTFICPDCYNKIIKEKYNHIIISSTHNLEGYSIKEYYGIESVEIVIGTGWFSEFTGEISDIFGIRSTQFEKKLQNAKDTASTLLKRKAYEKGANAIVGADLDYTEFSGNRIGLILNGTLVRIEKI